MVGTARRPDWFQTILDEYRADVACSFLLHGMIFDYVEHPTSTVTPTEYLTQILGARMTVVTFSPDGGIQFPGTPAMAKASKERFEKVVEWSAAESLYGEAAQAPELPSDPEGALPHQVKFLTSADGNGLADGGDGTGLKGIVILERLDLICAPGDKGTMDRGRLAILSLLHRAGTNDQILTKGNLLVGLTPSLASVHEDLRLSSAGTRAIEIPPPDFAQRLSYARRLIAEKEVALVGISESELAGQTAALARRHIEDIVLRAVREGGSLTPSLVRDRKAEAIRTEYAEVLEIIEPDQGFESIGGHQLAINFLQRRVIPTLVDEDKADAAPMGIALFGPSGTGKTLFASALGKETGFNVLQFNLGIIKTGVVGGTEAKRDKAFAGMRALAPCVVFLDEADQQFRRGQGGADGGGGGAVENSMFASILEFFGRPENRGQILLVLASNRPDLIDSAVLRPGRVDVKIPLLAPESAEARADVISTVCRSLGLDASWPTAPEIFLGIGETTENFTQAELAGLVRSAVVTMKIEGNLSLLDAIAQEQRYLVTATKDVRWWSELAVRACNDRRLVPDNWLTLLGQGIGEVAAREQAREAVVAGAGRRGGKVLDLDDVGGTP